MPEGTPKPLVNEDASLNLKAFAEQFGSEGKMLHFFGFSATLEEALNIDGKGKCPFGAMVSSAFAKEGLKGVQEMLKQNNLAETVPISDEQVVRVDRQRQDILRRAGGKNNWFGR